MRLWSENDPARTRGVTECPPVVLAVEMYSNQTSKYPLYIVVRYEAGRISLLCYFRPMLLCGPRTRVQLGRYPPAAPMASATIKHRTKYSIFEA